MYIHTNEKIQIPHIYDSSFYNKCEIRDSNSCTTNEQVLNLPPLTTWLIPQLKCKRRESNPNQRLGKPLSYPLDHGCLLSLNAGSEIRTHGLLWEWFLRPSPLPGWAIPAEIGECDAWPKPESNRCPGYGSPSSFNWDLSILYIRHHGTPPCLIKDGFSFTHHTLT